MRECQDVRRSPELNGATIPREGRFQVRLGAAGFRRLGRSLASQPFRIASRWLNTGGNVRVRTSVCGEGRKPPNHTESLNSVQDLGSQECHKRGPATGSFTLTRPVIQWKHLLATDCLVSPTFVPQVSEDTASEGALLRITKR